MTRATRSTPFIIWTLQRTGGTNLARWLFEQSGLLEAAKSQIVAGTEGAYWLDMVDTYWKLHEPFNFGKERRTFAEASEKCILHKDIDAAEKAMREILLIKLPIKHCVEMVPWEISKILVKVSCEIGYKHLFLYRKNELNRLLSLQYAKLSGVWGPNMKDQQLLAEKIFAEPLPIASLISHETRCSLRMDQTWHALGAAGNTPHLMAFEDIYENPDSGDVEKQLTAVFALLGFPRREEEKQLIKDIIGTGDQGTKNEYGSFKGIDALAEALKAVKLFSPFSKVYTIHAMPLFGAGSDPIMHATIDMIPPAVELGRAFDLGGVVVLRKNLPGNSAIEITGDTEGPSIKWNIDSPWMAKKYPSSPNGAHARFKILNMKINSTEPTELYIRDGSGSNVPVFRLTLQELM